MMLDTCYRNLPLIEVHTKVTQYCSCASEDEDGEESNVFTASSVLYMSESIFVSFVASVGLRSVVVLRLRSFRSQAFSSCGTLGRGGVLSGGTRGARVDGPDAMEAGFK
jgi:hypothetical protein